MINNDWWRDFDPYYYYFEKQREHPPEKTICKHWGCGKELTLQERLSGDKCLKHQKDKRGHSRTISVYFNKK